MNLYYLNQRVNALLTQAKNDMYARWRLGELLSEAERNGCLIVQDKQSGKITITGKKGGV